MANRAPMTRRQFLASLGLGALSLALLRLEMLQSVVTAIVPDEPRSAAYGQSAYGA